MIFDRVKDMAADFPQAQFIGVDIGELLYVRKQLNPIDGRCSAPGYAIPPSQRPVRVMQCEHSIALG